MYFIWSFFGYLVSHCAGLLSINATNYVEV